VRPSREVDGGQAGHEAVEDDRGLDREGAVRPPAHDDERVVGGEHQPGPIGAADDGVKPGLADLQAGHPGGEAAVGTSDEDGQLAPVPHHEVVAPVAVEVGRGGPLQAVGEARIEHHVERLRTADDAEEARPRLRRIGLGLRRIGLGLRRLDFGLFVEIDDELVDAVGVEVDGEGDAAALALPQAIDAQAGVRRELAEAVAAVDVEERAAAVAVEIADEQLGRAIAGGAQPIDAAARIDALDVRCLFGQDVKARRPVVARRHCERDRIGLDRPAGARAQAGLAVAEEDRDCVVEDVEGGEVDRAVGVEVGGDDGGGREADGVTRAGREAAAPVAEQDLDRALLGDCDGEIEAAIAVEIGAGDVARAGADAQRRIGDEVAEDREGAFALVDDHQLGRAGGVEIEGDEPARAVADGDPLGLGQDAPATAAQHRDLVAPGQGGGDVEPPVAVEIGDRQAPRARADRPARGCPIEHVLGVIRIRAPPDHADGAEGVAGADEVGVPVGVEVGDADGVRRQAPGIGAGAGEVEAEDADPGARAGIGRLAGRHERAEAQRAHEREPRRCHASSAAVRSHEVSDWRTVARAEHSRRSHVPTTRVPCAADARSASPEPRLPVRARTHHAERRIAPPRAKKAPRGPRCGVCGDTPRGHRAGPWANLEFTCSAKVPEA
jgi:hypothetical protein